LGAVATGAVGSVLGLRWAIGGCAAAVVTIWAAILRPLASDASDYVLDDRLAGRHRRDSDRASHVAGDDAVIGTGQQQH
jgi:hypothetical protein